MAPKSAEADITVILENDPPSVMVTIEVWASEHEPDEDREREIGSERNQRLAHFTKYCLTPPVWMSDFDRQSVSNIPAALMELHEEAAALAAHRATRGYDVLFERRLEEVLPQGVVIEAGR